MKCNGLNVVTGCRSVTRAFDVGSRVNTGRFVDLQDAFAECFMYIVQGISIDTAQCIARPLVTSQENSTSDTDPSDSRLDTLEESFHSLFSVNLAEQR